LGKGLKASPLTPASVTKPNLRNSRRESCLVIGGDCNGNRVAKQEKEELGQAFLKVAAGLKRKTFSGKFGVLTPTKTEEGHHGV
jgi:hypothetical protein